MAEGSGQEEVGLGRALEEAKRHVAPCAEACATVSGRGRDVRDGCLGGF